MTKRSKAPLLVALMVATAGTVGYGVRAARADGVADTGTLTYTGTLEDTAGKPISGTKSIGVTVWDAPTAGTKVCGASPSNIDVLNGRFDVTLPDACATAAQTNPKLWIEVTVAGESLGRARMGAVPYAIEAGRASEASGGLKTSLEAAQTAIAGLQAAVVNVPVITAWTTFPVKATLTSGATTDAPDPGAWRRVGDSIEVRIIFVAALPNSSGELVTFNLPPGIVVDHSKIPRNGGVVGAGEVGAGPSQTLAGVIYAKDAPNTLRLEVTGTGQSGYNVTTSNPFPANTGSWNATLNATLPVSGWTTSSPLRPAETRDTGESRDRGVPRMPHRQVPVRFSHLAPRHVLDARHEPRRC